LSLFAVTAMAAATDEKSEKTKKFLCTITFKTERQRERETERERERERETQKAEEEDMINLPAS
jgi:hypothetical protein